MSPLTFGGRFGWLHDPATLHDWGHRTTGVVIVSAIGRDARCAHRPLRLFADQLAREGYPTLRYDHLGAGDSLEVPAGTETLAEWLAGVRAAVALLKEQTCVTGVVLAGLRLGAGLAAMASEGADGLILLAPVVSGRTWLRELRLSGAMNGTPTDGAATDRSGFEADGVEFSSATAASLSALDLRQIRHAPAEVLLVGRDTGAGTLAARLADLGARVEDAPFEGYAELFEDAHSNLAPTALFDLATAWMQDRFAQLADGQAPDIAAEPATLTLDGATERAVLFGEGLRGVVCSPSGKSTQQGVIFLNSGGDPRAGIGRFAVQAARCLAWEGIASLRFDLAGLGDSDDPSKGVPRHIYDTPRGADVAAAIDLMQAQGCSDITLTGICAGAHHGVNAAIADSRVARVLGISLVKMVWRPGDSLAIGKRDEGRSTRTYMEALGNRSTWLRLLRGEVHVVSVARTLASRFAERMAVRREESTGQFQKDIARLAARGAKVRLLMGTDDASLDELETYFGPQGERLTALPGMIVEIVPGLDHGLARAASRTVALASLRDLLDLK